MFHPVSVYVGLRYVVSRRRGFFVSFISWISMLGMPFHVSDPPELVEHVRDLARRYAAALP